MIFKDINTTKEFISNSLVIEYDDSFNLSKYCASLLRDSDEAIHGRDIVIRVKDAWHKINENTKPIWNDILESAGLYPYVDPKSLSKSAQLRYEYHKSPYLSNVYLHEEQQNLSIELSSGRSVVVSAPTSFGKSLLIEEIIAGKYYKQIVIIQPTLALLDETRKKLLKYKSSYKLIVSTNQEPDQQNGNIFLFTGERVVEYNKFPQIDFFVIDEFYKLSLERDDDRAISLNQAFHKLLKFTNKFYLLGPMVKNIPLSFKQKFELTWFRTDFATVAVNEVSLEINSPIKAKEKKQLKKDGLFKLLVECNDQTLIYCSSPNKATMLGLEFAKYLINFDLSTPVENVADNDDIIEWIDENINSKWSLNLALKHGIGFHHGALPRHLGSSVVDGFNNGAIRWLFCTSTLIEGVNTAAKTVVLFDKEKGRKQIDFFDYKNIAGRSGRMNKHYIGNVIRFEKQPSQMELFVDIPLFNQKAAPIELLVTLENEEIDDDAKGKLQEFNLLSQDLKDVLKKNAAINIDGQQKIIAAIENNLDKYKSDLNWTFPTYNQLLSVIELAWNFLLKPGDNKADIRNPAQLTVLTNKYSNLKSIRALINDLINDHYWIGLYPDDQLRINTVTFFVLNIARHWFDYKLPKWISIVSSLQEYVFKKHGLPFGNYTFFASNLEHGFLPPNLAALTEYDIPSSTLNKLRRIINNEKTPENIIIDANRMSTEKLRELGLLRYEILKLRDAF